MALTAMMKDFVHHVPSFNDLNTMPEDPMSGMHSEYSGNLDAMPRVSDQTPAAAPMMERAPSKKMTNKKADEPAMQVIDYHEFDKHRSTTGTQRHHIFDHPKPMDGGKVPSVWEMIIKSENYMKGERDQNKDMNAMDNTAAKPMATREE